MTPTSKELGIAMRRAMFNEEYKEPEGDDAFTFLNEFILERFFGDLWNRKQLDLKTRSLCTIAALIAGHMPDDTLKAHVIGALANGATEDRDSRGDHPHRVLCGRVGVVVSARPVAEGVFNARRGK